jgi:thioredoxin reductase (NADPH)
MRMDNHYKVVIIGSGPAGLTAAIYAGRANLNPIVFEGIQPGGQLTITTEVENYPGFPEGILGPELMDLFRKQAKRFNATTVFQDVSKVDFSKRPFRIYSNDQEYVGDSVIIATGASAKWIGVPSEQEYRGYGVSACATCDAFFFRGLEVVVVGGGDTAMEEASFLTKFASKVTILHRRDKLRASKIMQERVFKNPKIAFVWDSVIEEVLGRHEDGKKSVTGVRLKNVRTGEVSVFRTDGVFVGDHRSRNRLHGGNRSRTVLGKQARLNEFGFLIADFGRGCDEQPRCSLIVIGHSESTILATFCSSIAVGGERSFG